MYLEGIPQSFHDLWFTFVSWIPTVILVILILIVGWIIAGVFNSVVHKLLKKAGLDKQLAKNDFGKKANDALDGASRFAGKVVYWVILLGTLGVAANQLDLQPVNELVAAIYSYIPNVLEALAIFVIAVMVSAFVTNVVNRTLGDTPTGRIAKSVVPVVILSIAGFMVLTALELAPEIVQITYTALVGALALGMALAFGLGGRDVAARLLEQAYEKGQHTAKQAKTDKQKGGGKRR